MKKVYFELESLDKIHEAARYFLNAVGDANIFAIDGDMGVGKTTFIKAVCEELGVKDVITSPTFSLVNEYTDGKGEPVYHFDFYRIKKIAEVFDIGVEQYFDSLVTYPNLTSPPKRNFWRASSFFLAIYLRNSAFFCYFANQRNNN